MECNDSFPARYRAAVFIGTSVVALSGDTEAPLCCRTLWLRHRGFLGEVRNLNVTELGPRGGVQWKSVFLSRNLEGMRGRRVDWARSGK